MIILVSIMWAVGVILLRKQNDILGWLFILTGWLLSVIVEILFSSAWDRGFGSFFVGLVFVWFVQRSINTYRKNAPKNKHGHAESHHA